MDAPLLRLLPLLLLPLLPPSLRGYFSASHRPAASTSCGAGGLHPIVLVSGVSCPDVEAWLTDAYAPSAPRCGRMKGKGWFGLWTNGTYALGSDLVGCLEEQMRLVYDPVLNDYRDAPGVETRVPNFGSARGFTSKKPQHPEYCLATLRSTLERAGYRDGETLFGAPYDLRYGPPLPGQPSEVYSRYFRRFMGLVESASKKNGGKPAIIFGHSFGGTVALEFVRNTPLPWRNKFIKHLILVAPIWSGGIVDSLKGIVSGPTVLYLPTANILSVRSMWRSFETAIENLPSPEVFGRRPLVITKHKNYSAHDTVELFAALGFADGITPFRRRKLPKMRNFQAPMVPLTYINGVGVPTAEQLVLWEHDFDVPPEVVYGDGDDTINLISMLAFEEKIGEQPGQKERFKAIKIAKVKHSALVTDERALTKVIDEILEANSKV